LKEPLELSAITSVATLAWDKYWDVAGAAAASWRANAIVAA
jgi:hypothetical protein